MIDLVIDKVRFSNGTVGAIAVDGGRIVETGEGPFPAARETVAGHGLTALAGVIDSHVHFNEPGRTEWEGVETGSRAAAAGGVTLFADMPLNSDPPLLTPEAFHAKLTAYEGRASVDYAFWGGLTPQSLPHMDELAGLGVMGFKAFLCNSGIPEFAAADDATLLRGMETAARLGLPVGVHAENDAITLALTEATRAAHSVADARAFLASRPIVAEAEAVARALLLAEETGCRLHVVHASCARAVELVLDARLRGVDATVETCGHYLHFCDTDVARIGTAAKCAPPIRSVDERDALWRFLAGGEIDFVASDHSPAPPEMKLKSDFLSAWGGVNGVSFTLPILLSGAATREMALERAEEALSAAAAQRYGFAGKGRIAPGYDADIVLVAMEQRYQPTAETLETRHRVCPYLGETFTARVARTILRGRTVWADGRVQSAPSGRFVRPATTGGPQ